MEMTEKADPIRHFLTVWRPRQEWHGDETASGQKPEQSECPRLSAPGYGKIMMGHRVNGLRSA
jgi:hypothetical protein